MVKKASDGGSINEAEILKELREIKDRLTQIEDHINKTESDLTYSEDIVYQLAKDITEDMTQEEQLPAMTSLEGFTIDAIVDRKGTSYSSVHRIIKRLKEKGLIEEKHAKKGNKLYYSVKK